jgi:hypothetical protein
LNNAWVMSEAEFDQTVVGQAARSYLAYVTELIALAKEVPLMYNAVNALAQIAKQNQVAAERRKPLLNASLLIGAWGALEAFVADVCVATLRENPQALREEEVKAIKVPITDLLASDDEKAEIIFSALESKLFGQKGVNCFEALLKYIDLDGPVPPTPKNYIFAAQQIRNVWAHKAGRADKHFVEQVPFLSYNIGDAVELNDSDTLIYLGSLFMYGQVLMSRLRVEKGLPPYTVPEVVPWKAEYEKIFPASEQAPSP